DRRARAGGVDRHARGLGRTLDQDLADAGLRQLLAQHFAHFQVGCQVTSELGLVGVPLGVPVLGNTEADTNRMNFMTHGLFLSAYLPAPTTTVMWLVRLRMRVPRPFARAMKRFRVGPSSTMMVLTFSASTSAPWLFSALAMADSTTFLIRWAAFLSENFSRLTARSAGRPRTWSATRRAFCGGMRTVRRLSFASMVVAPYFAFLSPPRPLKVRVTANSPSLWPTMFSLTSTGTWFLPLCT